MINIGSLAGQLSMVCTQLPFRPAPPLLTPRPRRGKVLGVPPSLPPPSARLPPLPRDSLRGQKRVRAVPAQRVRPRRRVPSSALRSPAVRAGASGDLLGEGETEWDSSGEKTVLDELQ